MLPAVDLPDGSINPLSTVLIHPPTRIKLGQGRKEGGREGGKEREREKGRFMDRIITYSTTHTHAHIQPYTHTAIHTYSHAHIQPCTQTAIHTYPVPSEAAEDLSEEGGDDDRTPGGDHHTSGHNQAAAIPVPIELSPAQLREEREEVTVHTAGDFFPC